MADLNGATGADHDDTVDDELVETITARIEPTRRRRDELAAELAATNARLKRYERALGALAEPKDPAPTERRKPGPKPKQGPGPRTSIGDERLAQIEAMVRELAAEGDEVRQVDVRNRLAGVNSSTSAIAFEQLRQRNVIRLARQEGNNKYYRLTREALNEAAAAPPA